MIFFLLPGCKDKSSPTSNDNTAEGDTSVIAKSPKRGLAFDITDPADFETLSQGVSWWYNWSATTSAPSGYQKAYQMEFIPMVWGGNPSPQTMEAVKNFILAHPEIQYLLVLNEPNLTDQANRTPAQAATDWVKYEQIITNLAAQNRTVYLVGPAMSWGTMTGLSDPVTWLDAFYSAYRSANGGRDPRIDYLAFHWYDYGLAAQLDRLQKYGKKIWITEMANWNAQINSYAKQEAQMRDMVNICETRTDVFRYAWFYGRGPLPDSKYTYLLDQSPGTLTNLGVLYLTLPYSK
ncbi:hypothetical protein EHM92_00725 [bacterium]|nr:MAG: hypothetical protein EHM92_00725 [bacterium]